MNKCKNQNGITLIALVITIIVMLILVAVTITMAVNGGLFDYARSAGQQTNQAVKNEQELASIASNLTTDELIGKYTGGWYPKGDGTFTNGKSTVAIGDYINYQPYNSEIDEHDLTYISQPAQSGYEDPQTFTVTEDSNDIKWRVLGVENGNLLIMITTPQSPAERYDYDLVGDKGYNNGISELNNISKIYGHGEYAVGARSINVDDVNKITGYNPLKEADGLPHEDGEVYEYKNGPIIYTLTDDGVTYECKNGSGKSLWSKELLDLGANKSSKTLTIAESTYYWYEPDNEMYMNTVMSREDVKYKMLFGETKDKLYWLASSYIETNSEEIVWGMRSVVSGAINYSQLWYSGYGYTDSCYCVCPLIALSPDITLTEGTVIEEGVGSWNLPEGE